MRDNTKRPMIDRAQSLNKDEFIALIDTKMKSDLALSWKQLLLENFGFSAVPVIR